MSLKVFLLLFYQFFVVYSNEKILPSMAVRSNLTSTLLTNYLDYSVMLHCDTNTSKYFDFLYQLDKTQVRLLNNYDKNPIIRRPVGYKFLHVVFLKNAFQFGNFTRFSYNIEYNDIIVFLNDHEIQLKSIDEEAILRYWHLEGLHRAGNIFLVGLSQDELYFVCYYCGTTTGTLEEISVDETSPSGYYHIHGFVDFREHHFDVGFANFPPFFWCRDNSNTVGNCFGPENLLLKLLSEKLNFKYNLVNFTGSAKGEWRKLIEQVHYNNVDWAVGGISTSIEREKLVDTTNYIHSESFLALFSTSSISSGAWRDWDRVLLPFQFDVWLCMIFVQLLIAYLLRITSLWMSDDPVRGFAYYLEITFRAVIEQAMPKIFARSPTKRGLMALWWCSAIIFVTAYNSKLAASLVKPRQYEPNSVTELLNSGYGFQVNNKDWDVLKENLEESLDPGYEKIERTANSDLDVCTAVAKTINNKVALIDEETSLQYEIKKHCYKYLSLEHLASLRFAKHGLFPSNHVWPLQVGAPYGTRFAFIISNLRAAGILTRWYNLALARSIPRSNQYVNLKRVAPLSKKTMSAPALLLGFGLLASTIVFFSELMYFYVENLVRLYVRNK